MNRILKISNLFKRIKDTLWLSTWEAQLVEQDLQGNTIGRVTHFDYSHKQFNVALDSIYLEKMFNEKNFNGIYKILLHEILHIVLGAPSKTREDEPTVKQMLGEHLHNVVCNHALEREEQKVSDITELLMGLFETKYKKELKKMEMEIFPPIVLKKKRKKK